MGFTFSDNKVCSDMVLMNKWLPTKYARQSSFPPSPPSKAETPASSDTRDGARGRSRRRRVCGPAGSAHAPSAPRCSFSRLAIVLLVLVEIRREEALPLRQLPSGAWGPVAIAVRGVAAIPRRFWDARSVEWEVRCRVPTGPVHSSTLALRVHALHLRAAVRAAVATPVTASRPAASEVDSSSPSALVDRSRLICGEDTR